MPWGMGQGARAISESVTPLLFALTAALAGWPECQGLAQSCWLLAQGGWSRDSVPLPSLLPKLMAPLCFGACPGLLCLGFLCFSRAVPLMVMLSWGVHTTLSVPVCPSPVCQPELGTGHGGRKSLGKEFPPFHAELT